MTTLGVIVAGGLGSRMARSHPARPKPLVEVAGRTLIEYQLQRMVSAGVRTVRIAVRHGAQAIRDHVAGLSCAGEVELEFLEEQEPLGTIGCLYGVRGTAATVLVTNGDLLSGIDLRALLEDHRARGSALTIATHDEHHRLKLGEVIVGPDARVRAYAEKPVKTYRISSGTYVLEPQVLELLVRPEWLGIPDLVTRALGAGQVVREHHHEAAWIDVNDADDLARAEAWVAADPAAFGRAPGGVRSLGGPGH